MSYLYSCQFPKTVVVPGDDFEELKRPGHNIHQPLIKPYLQKMQSELSLHPHLLYTKLRNLRPPKDILFRKLKSI